MSTPYKPLSEQIASRMIADLKIGTSIFQRPDNNLNSALPFNIESGQKYAGPSALVLLMQKRDDPRWGTSNQANRNHTAVLKNATGTLINFMTSYEFQKAVDGDGQPILKDNGKQRVDRIKLDEPKQVDAWLFNGEQMRTMPRWEKEPQELSPVEKAQAILANSGVKIEHGGDDMLFDIVSDTIVIPEPEQFATPEQYYAEAMHQLVHRELEAPREGGSISKDELRANLASLFLSKELNLPYDLNYHAAYLNDWSKNLKEEPGELFNAASDAQKVVDKVMSYSLKIEEQQEEGQKNEAAEQQEEGFGMAAEVAELPKYDPDKLTKGEVIPHNGTEFKVLAVLKNNNYNMQDLGDKRKFKMDAGSGLFQSLVEARNSSQEISTGKITEREFEGEKQAQEQDNEIDNNYAMQR